MHLLYTKKPYLMVLFFMSGFLSYSVLNIWTIYFIVTLTLGITRSNFLACHIGDTNLHTGHLFNNMDNFVISTNSSSMSVFQANKGIVFKTTTNPF